MTTIIIILVNISCFILMYLATRKAARSSANALPEAIKNTQKLNSLNHKHLLCICACLLVLIFHSVFDQSVMEWFKLPGQKVFLPIFIISLFTIIISYSSPVRPIEVFNGFAINSRQVNSPLNFVPVLITYALIRTLYLISYEIFFRLTLIESIEILTGTNSAIIISTILYGFLHRFSRTVEFYSSFLFGLILSWVVIHTGSILPAIFIHLLLSLPYELRIIHHQKTISI